MQKLPAIVVTGEIGAGPLGALNKSRFNVLHKPVAPAKRRTFLHNLPAPGELRKH
jgi:hypothetical protein